MTTKRRLATIGALAAAAVAVPALAALGATAIQPTPATTATTTTATGPCLAWFGSRDDGQCLSYSNGQGTSIGTPSVGFGGPNSGAPGLGISTGPLLPGQSISLPMG